MSAVWWLVLLAVVAWCLVGGLAFRLGHLRRMGRWYGRADMPALVRNLPLQLLPLAAFLGLLGVAAALAPRDGEAASPVGMACFLGSFVAMGWWLWSMVRPARFLKPDWVRDHDRVETERREARTS